MRCNAPWNNMYFTVTGKVSPCWLTPGYVDNWSQSRSISDIWFGSEFERYRTNIRNQTYDNPKCLICKKDTDEGVWPLAKAYDNFSIKKYPTLMELELSNQCNLECVMCSGMLSSGIRKNRDKLPPLPQIYDDSFVEQLKEFIPHLEELRFNGGEPFAQKIVLDICDVVAEIHPSLKINIATNGTVYNKRVEHILNNCNVHINISIDSLQKERYEQIRINGKFDLVMTNFKKFKHYSNNKNRLLCIMVNPMRNNWEEMVEFTQFANSNDVMIWYNTIRYPEHLAIWNLPTKDLVEIHDTLKHQFDVIDKTEKSKYSDNNHYKLDHLINNQLKNWILDSLT